MDNEIGVGRRGSIVVGLGLSLSFMLGVACGDDQGGETMAGSSGGTTVSPPDSTGPGTLTVSSSGADVSTGSEGSSGGTTMAIDGTSSSGDSSEETAIPEVFFPEVLTIFQAECFCHRTPMPASMLDLDDDAAYDSIVNVPAPQAPAVNYVTPGDPDNSYLYLKLTGEQLSVGGSGTRMPQGGMLTDDQIDLVRYWILGGALP
jgi:hypothetical protein